MDYRETIQIDPQINGRHIVIEYGVRMGPESVQRVDQEIRLARALYNNLMAEMRSTYGEMRAFVMEKAGTGTQAIVQQIAAVTEEFNLARAANDEPEMQRIAQVRRGLWKDLSVAIKVVRTEYKGELQDRFYSRIGNNRSARTYQIRCAAVRDGLGASTASAILNNALTAWKQSTKHGKPPPFAIGAEQIQDSLTIQFMMKGGLEIEKIFSGRDASLAIQLSPKGFAPRSYSPFRFRLGAAKAEIVAEGTVQTHRPIPAKSHVALARLVRRRIGAKARYALQLVLNLAEPVREQAPSGRSSLVAVHVGWSADENGRRIAGISGDGETATIMQLPILIEADLQRAQAIQGARDTRRDEIVAQLKAEMLIPDLPNEDALAIFWEKLCKSPAHHTAAHRLHYLARLLSEREILPEWLETWRKWDRMQWQATASLARRARNRRMWFYRNECKRLAEQYETILIHHPNLKEAARKLNEVTGEKTILAKKARAGRVVAAISLFEGAIKWAACRYGCAVLKMQGERTASVCAECGGEHLEVDKEDSQSLLCLDCGASLDRKKNGAILAWKIGWKSLESLVTDYWAMVLEQRNTLEERKAVRMKKMIDGRNAARKALNKDTG